jgi:hypothetical protein
MSLTLKQVQYYQKLDGDSERLKTLAEAKNSLSEEYWDKLVSILIKTNSILRNVKVFSRVDELPSVLPLAVNCPTWVISGEFNNLETNLEYSFAILHRTFRDGYLDLLVWNPNKFNLAKSASLIEKTHFEIEGLR